MADTDEYKNVHYLEDRIFSPLKLRRNVNVNVTVQYDNLGRNITEQEKRQNMVPWITVRKRKFRKQTNNLFK